MSPKTQTIVILILSLVIVGLLARFVIFKERFDDRGESLERLGERRDEYRRKNPNATDQEIDAAWEQGMDNLKQRRDDYKAEHPDASEADIDAARDAARSHD